MFALLRPSLLLLASLPAAAAAEAGSPPRERRRLRGGRRQAPPGLDPRRGRRILFVGDPARAQEARGGRRRVDLAGASSSPGWADAHLHLAGLGKSLEIADLRGAADAEDAARPDATTAASGLPAGTWVEAAGWDQNLWPGRAFPDARELDAVLPRPAGRSRARVDGHAVWVNSAALRAAGIDAATRDPEGGRILRRPDGSPSGVLVDNAMDLVEKVRPAPDRRRTSSGGFWRARRPARASD